MSRRWLLRLSVVANVALAVLLVVALAGGFDRAEALPERHFAGDRSARDKVAIVRVAGMLLEGTNGFAFQQVEAAATDPAVKAVVLRVDSPGGTVGVAEQLHKALTELRDGSHRRFRGAGPKPLTASFGSVAASGGYFIAMPARGVYAEPTTITGSIGVFAALPNVAELANRNGVKLTVIKAGAVKGAGSPFHGLTPADRQQWQDTVDSAYGRFLDVVTAGRPRLTRDVLAAPVFARTVPPFDDRGNATAGPPTTVSRSRADGGSFTPAQALDLGLIDGIDDLTGVVHRAAESAGLTKWRAVRYDPPQSWAEWLFGVKLAAPPPDLTAAAARFATPRVLALAPGYDAALAAGDAQSEPRP